VYLGLLGHLDLVVTLDFCLKPQLNIEGGEGGGDTRGATDGQQDVRTIILVRKGWVTRGKKTCNLSLSASQAALSSSSLFCTGSGGGEMDRGTHTETDRQRQIYR